MLTNALGVLFVLFLVVALINGVRVDRASRRSVPPRAPIPSPPTPSPPPQAPSPPDLIGEESRAMLQELLSDRGRTAELDQFESDRLRRAEERGGAATACTILHARAKARFDAGRYEDAARTCRETRAQALGIADSWQRQIQLFQSFLGEMESLGALQRYDDVDTLADEAIASATWPIALRLRFGLVQASAVSAAGRGDTALAICDGIIGACAVEAAGVSPQGFNFAYELQALAAEAMILKADILAGIGAVEDALALYAATAVQFEHAYEEQRDSEDMAARSLALEATLHQGRLLRQLGRAEEASVCFLRVKRGGSFWPSLQPKAAIAQAELEA